MPDDRQRDLALARAIPSRAARVLARTPAARRNRPMARPGPSTADGGRDARVPASFADHARAGARHTARALLVIQPAVLPPPRSWKPARVLGSTELSLQWPVMLLMIVEVSRRTPASTERPPLRSECRPSAERQAAGTCSPSSPSQTSRPFCHASIEDRDVVRCPGRNVVTVSGPQRGGWAPRHPVSLARQGRLARTRHRDYAVRRSPEGRF